LAHTHGLLFTLLCVFTLQKEACLRILGGVGHGACFFGNCSIPTGK